MPAAMTKELEKGPEPMIGKAIGPYRIRRKLGQGGMGVVYEAIHQTIGQRAAIKVLHEQLSASERSRERFLNEARAIGRVQHEGLVKIFDHGQLEDGTTYIIMEFMEGESLSERLEQRRREGRGLLEEEALRVVSQMATAIKVVHEKGIVHRDLKPENVFLVPDPAVYGGERAKLLDFGIAKFMDSVGRKTTVGMVLGTPIYMAPEQCEGCDLTDKVDVYALGVMFYELLCGQPPFVAESASALMRQHMLRDPPRLKDVLPSVRPDIAALVADMLIKEPVKRPTMAEVSARMEGPRPTLAQAISARPAESSVVPAVLAAALMVALLSGGLALFWPRGNGTGGVARPGVAAKPIAPPMGLPRPPAAMPDREDEHPENEAAKEHVGNGHGHGGKHHGPHRLPTLEGEVPAVPGPAAESHHSVPGPHADSPPSPPETPRPAARRPTAEPKVPETKGSMEDVVLH